MTSLPLVHEKILHCREIYHLENVKIIIACSGGIDSMTLLHACGACYPKSQIIVVHIHHMLRGSDADADQKHVELYCKQHGYTYISQTHDVTAYAEEYKLSIEEAGRIVRYRALEEIRTTYEAQAIWTAHHADDQIETFFYRLLKGSKITGLMAMQEKNGYLYRPFFSLKKQEILSYAQTFSIPYREDKSNTDTIYQRNFIRHEILPLCSSINPGYPDQILDLIHYFRECKQGIDEICSRVTQRENEHSFFLLETYFSLHPFFQKEYIRYLYADANHGTIGLCEANIAEIQRFLLGPNNPTEKHIKKLHLLKKNKKVYIGTKNI